MLAACERAACCANLAAWAAGWNAERKDMAWLLAWLTLTLCGFALERETCCSKAERLSAPWPAAWLAAPAWLATALASPLFLVPPLGAAAVAWLWLLPAGPARNSVRAP